MHVCVLVAVCVKLEHTNVIEYLMLVQEGHFIISLTRFICFFHYHVYSDGTLNPSGVRFGTAELYDIGKC